MRKIFTFVLVVIALSSLEANAHSGRTNKKGCHHDKKAGTYHCH